MGAYNPPIFSMSKCRKRLHVETIKQQIPPLDVFNDIIEMGVVIGERGI